MKQQTVITRIEEETTAGAGECLVFPQNRTLYVDRLSGYVPDTKEDRAVFSPKTLNDVFEHYRPAMEGLAVYDEDGDMRYEDFRFGKIEDFDDDNLIAQSETMTASHDKIDIYHDIMRHLERNRDLNRLLNDDEAKSALVDALRALRSEIK